MMDFTRVMLLLVMVLVPASTGNAAPAKSKIILILFGDSLTDTGNTLKAAGVPDPTIYVGARGVGRGRYSNGLIWIDYLRDVLAKKYIVEVYNYAYGGATACASPQLEALYPFVKNLTAQTGMFIQDVRSGKFKPDPSARTLVIQWIGNNDLAYAVKAALESGRMPSTLETLTLVRNIVACRMASIQTLASLTGIITNIAVVPIVSVRLPIEFSKVPRALQQQALFLESGMGGSTVQALRDLQTVFNAAARGTPGFGVKLFPVGTTGDWMYQGLIKGLRIPFPITNASCFINPRGALTKTPGVRICSRPADYLFYDQEHFNTRFHQWLGPSGILPQLQTLGLLPR